MRVRAIVVVLLLALFPVLLSAADSKSVLELYTSLNELKLNPSFVYTLPPGSRIELGRGDARLTFEEGRIALFTPVDGRVTGAVFSGRGHILAAPRDPVEKQQLALFTGAPLLDQTISSAYIRFTDETAAELQQQLQSAKIFASEDL